MTPAPGFEDIFAVMAAASVGDAKARVPLPESPQVNDPATRFAIALNLLLDDLELRGEERRQLEERLRQSQKMEAVGRLAGGVAHDFNNHLSVILGYAEMALEAAGADGGRQAAFLQRIKQAAERSAGLTHQLLAFSRSQVLAPRVLDMNDLIAEAQKVWGRLIGEQVEIRVVRTPNLGLVRIDPVQFDQVLLNLLLNARDAMPQGGRITIETMNMDMDRVYADAHPDVVPGPHVMLAVTDTGAGMDKETVSRIFEPFFTTKEVGRGTGLGLATVHGVVKQSGGHIWVYSEPGRGTTFKIYLPRVYNGIHVVEAGAAAVVTSAGGWTVLVVEDEELVRDMVCDALRRSGIKVLAAGDGQEALRICREHAGTIDLLLSDVVMGGMSGPELARAILELRPTVKVVFMSGYTESAVLERAMVGLHAAFLQKPITPAVLIARLQEVSRG